MRQVLRGLWFLAMVFAFASAAVAADPSADRVDALFSTWNKPDSAGLALAVVRGGGIVYSRGYGSASLEHRAANTPATVFHAASLSKQFTAFAVHLLAQDGKLSLDDEVRKHVPELQPTARPITIRHLLHHTSGLRDQWSLLQLSGLRLDDTITEGDILGLLWQQRELNFQPGEEELYSNSGYTLLALVVRRVSGQSLAEFARGRIFEPLGMKSTHFHEQYGALVPGRAYSYQRTRSGYRYVALSFSNVGATSLFTTVEDLARWDANFRTARVGGADVQAAMLVTGRLANGRETQYASGLVKARYRGLSVLEHSGSDAGYRSYMLRFPQQDVSVLILANASDVAAQSLARAVADLFLEGTPGLEPARSLPAEVPVQAADLAAFTGDYEMRPGFLLRFTAEGDRLAVQATGQPQFPLFASAASSFFTKAFEASVDFGPAGAVWHQGGRDFPLRRITRTTPAAAAMAACTGDFFSAELRTVYSLSLRDGKLLLRYPRAELELRPVDGEVFAAPHPIGSVAFQRDAAGRCDAFRVTTGRVRHLLFTRVDLAPALRSPALATRQ